MAARKRPNPKPPEGKKNWFLLEGPLGADVTDFKFRPDGPQWCESSIRWHSMGGSNYLPWQAMKDVAEKILEQKLVKNDRVQIQGWLGMRKRGKWKVMICFVEKIKVLELVEREELVGSASPANENPEVADTFL